jgi:TetR/AcrR family transcriptional regulator, regulator of autoinduction and epiphytic fitness
VTDAATTADGRTQRRERNRTAVVEALLELYREGHLDPSTDEIAARAGVSPRSLFRYFEDVDALVEVAVARQQERLAPLFAVTVDPTLGFDERLERLVATRLDLYEGMGHVARVARAVANHQPRAAAELTRIRAFLREQLATAFAAELGSLPRPARAQALAAADVLTSWEAVDLLRRDQGLDRAAAAAVVEAGLRAVLG